MVAALDAQRGDVYVGEYQVIHSEVPSELRLHRIDEVLMSLGDFTASLGARIPVPVTYTPDATVERAVRESGSAVEKIPRPGADLIARLGVAKYLQGLTTSSEALDANFCAVRMRRYSPLHNQRGRRSNRMRVRPAEFNDIPRLMAIERQSPGAAHWGEREYHALFDTTLAGGASNEGSVPKRLCLVVEMASEVAAFAVAGCGGALPGSGVGD